MQMQIQRTEKSIYVDGGDSGKFAEWSDPKSLQMNAKVIALTTAFALVICYFGFCCGACFIYKLRHRLPTRQEHASELESRPSIEIPREFLEKPDTKTQGTPSPNKKSYHRVDFYGTENSMAKASDNGLLSMEQKLKMQYADPVSSYNQPFETPNTAVPSTNSKKKGLKKRQEYSPFNPQDLMDPDDLKSYRLNFQKEDAKEEISEAEWAQENRRIEQQKQSSRSKPAAQQQRSQAHRTPNNVDLYGLDELVEEGRDDLESRDKND